MAESTAYSANNVPSLLNLNDDCILEILTWLPLLDLCIIRNICSRLRRLTDYHFSRMHKSLNFNSSNIKDGPFKLITTDETVKILSAFGQQTDSMTMRADNFSSETDQLLPILDAFCMHRRLKHLKLIKFTFVDDFITNRTQPFANVEKITLDNCYAGGNVMLDELIKKFKSMSHLELIRRNDIDGVYLTHAYPSMQEFSVKTYGNLESQLMEVFLMKNKQLKHLNITNCCGVSDEIYVSIAELSELETLTVRMIQISPNCNANLMRLLKLDKLRELEIECFYQPVADFLNELAVKNQIESLGLASIDLTDAVSTAIGHLKSIQKLKLVSICATNTSIPIKQIAAQLPNIRVCYLVSSHTMKFDNVIEFIENAPKLEKLMISSCPNIAPFDDVQFHQLVEICGKRSDKLQLTVHIEYDDLNTIKHQIDKDVRQKCSEVVQLIQISAEEKDCTAFRGPSRYFAEEGGAVDYDSYGDFDDDFDDNSDDSCPLHYSDDEFF